MAQPNRRNLYRDNGAAAYDVYAWNDQTARQYDDNRAYERTLPIELPDERAYEQPYRRVKARTAIAPFTLAGMLTVVCLMILVISAMSSCLRPAAMSQPLKAGLPISRSSS